MSSSLQLLAALRAEGMLSALDEQLSRSLCALVAETSADVRLAIALLSRHVAAGHVCLPLDSLSSPELALGAEHAALAEHWPDHSRWLDALRASQLCARDEHDEPASPLVLDGGRRLYFRRHYTCERELAAQLRARAAQRVSADPARVEQRLSHHFGAAPDALQRRAAELATQRALCVISGGPGTGKTSTVVKILAVAVEEALAAGQMAPRIVLTAPTGKAAVRLQSAVLGAKQRLVTDARVLSAIPESASTIHRLMSAALRRDRSEVLVRPDKLPVDLLLVDEASMVDLQLMTQLLAVLQASTRVILLGDRDQLASVEAGAVLGDICAVARSEDDNSAPGDLARCIVQLTRSYRYDEHSGIGQLARAVQAGDAERALEILDDPRFPDVTLDEGDGALIEPESPLGRAVLDGYRPYLEAQEPAQALRLFDGFRVLCAHRQGERGVVGLNREIARLLSAARLVSGSEGSFVGRPVLITENDYRTRLWNGDVGVVGDSGDGSRCAYFVDADGSLRRLGLGRLPPHDSAFALSVHKSQGSEVDVVSLVLPLEPSRILSRELLYTGITRARKRVVVHGTRAVIRAAVTQAVSRNTGLQELLG